MESLEVTSQGNEEIWQAVFESNDGSLIHSIKRLCRYITYMHMYNLSV